MTRRGGQPEDGVFSRRAEEIFALVADAQLGEVDALLERECGGDLTLRREVESLLHFDETDVTFLHDMVLEEAASVGGTLESRWIGRRVGPWKITGVLGRGGMGAVYEVHRDDGAFRQRAALKVIRAELDGEAARRRFVEERQILAHLNHPNIARLIDGGESEGVPFLVMEAVEGQSLTDYCAQRNASVEERLRLFITVCRAVHFAHTQLIVHRDLKPSNILVTADGTVKLLDFGIAKLLDAERSGVRTLAGDVAFTPEYASPEQVRAEPVTTSTDIYSLGAVLFHLLTGRPAHVFSSHAYTEIARVICSVDPAPPSQSAPPKWTRPLRGDVDNIVLMALRKEPARRYLSAEQFAADIEGHLAGLPVAARADSFGYRAGKFIRRNRLAVAASVLVVLSLLGGMAGTIYQARRAERRFADVRALANTFLFQFHDEIRDLPGSTPARELLVRTALQYLDALSRDAESDAALQMELAAAYDKVGDVLGNPSNPNLGRTDEALRSYERSLALRQTASGRAVDTTDEAFAIVQSHVNIAQVLLGKGRTEEAEAHAAKAAAVAGQSGDAEEQLALLTLQGDLALRKGDLAVAEPTFRRALRVAEAAAKRKDSLESTALVVRAASRLGNVYKVQSRQKECLETLQIALTAAERLRTAEPTRTTHVRQVMKIREDRGDALRSQFAAEGMRPDLSLREYQQSLVLAERLSAADPADYSTRVAVYFARAQVADTWREIEPARALPLLRDLEQMGDELRREDPSNFQVQWIGALLTYVYADSVRRTDDLRAALPHYDVAITRIAAMRESDRGRKISFRDIMKTHAERGEVRLALGDLRGATADATACRSFLPPLELQAARPLDLRDSAYCLELNGDVAARNGKRAEAVTHYDAALARWAEFQRRGMESAFLRGRRESAERRRAENAAATVVASR